MAHVAYREVSLLLRRPPAPQIGESLRLFIVDGKYKSADTRRFCELRTI